MSDTGISKFQQLVDDINLLFPDANLSLPAGIEPTVSSLITLIKSNVNITKDIPELIFAIYLVDSDLETVKQKIQKFYRIIVPDGLEDYISKLIKPQIKTTLQLSVGLEFPTSVLQPVTEGGTPIPNEKSIFKFAEATFSLDTEGDMGSQFELGGSLIPQYAEIGKTGIVVSFTNAKLDLSSTTNIPEATAAGYPMNFIGMYVQLTSVSINKFGKDNPDKPSATISADNLFVGTGGVSGKISLEDNGLLYHNFGNFEAELDQFSIIFRQNAIVDSAISGKITLPSGFTGEDNQPSVIRIDGHIMDNGDFSITGTFLGEQPAFTFPNVFTVAISGLRGLPVLQHRQHERRQFESGRDAHLAGEIAKALMAHADELLAAPPVIEKIDLLAVK